MANLVVTSTTNSIKVEFNDATSIMGGREAGAWSKNGGIHFVRFPDHIEAHTLEEPRWVVSYDGAGNSLQIDSVDGVAPASNNDLYTKLAALIA